MDIIKVDKEQLLVTIKKNRDEHRNQFEQAIEGYRKAVVDRLEEMITNAKNNRKIEQHVNLPQPEDHTKDYDRVIQMLEMCLDAEIEISSMEFSQYVQDDWGWKERFLTTSSAYMNA